MSITEDPLANPRRETIYSHLKHNPNQTQTDIVHETGIPRSSVDYHTHVLSKEKLITDNTKHGHRYYVVMSDTRTDRDREEIERTLSQLPERTVETFDVIRDHDGPMTNTEIADTLDRTPQTISHHVNRLENNDLITRERVGRTTEIHITEHIREFLK